VEGGVVNPRALLRRLAAGHVHNVAFRDMQKLVEGFGYRLDRIEGSHHIFLHPEIAELINLQEVSGEAKPYQIRQVLRIVERFNLKLKENS
jgi:predicted RNA binding protein YcfA (HicA-like mRNA interferase family)